MNKRIVGPEFMRWMRFTFQDTVLHKKEHPSGCPSLADQAHFRDRPVSACGLINVRGERTRPGTFSKACGLASGVFSVAPIRLHCDAFELSVALFHFHKVPGPFISLLKHLIRTLKLCATRYRALTKIVTCILGHGHFPSYPQHLLEFWRQVCE